MLMLPSPRRLLLGYLLGAAMTSVTLGLLIVFKFEESGAVDTAKSTLSPSADIVLGGLLLIVAYAFATERRRGYRSGGGRRRPTSRKRNRPGKSSSARAPRGTPSSSAPCSPCRVAPTWRGSRTSATSKRATAGTVACVLGFNVIMLALLELPLIGYTFAPEWTPRAVRRFREGLSRHGGRALLIGAFVLGGLLVLRGVIELLA